ncbi:hypothetical protein [Paenarthrobacter sp. YJN-D]|jgi:Tfp pilus assembly protein PilE|uniref:hypothetical protein n=1 Tax=Paenarthrobacter TaxID=1742992 RepID=UPI0018A54EA1|nr:hypothetical protein [Paenarthrobacter sp. YJN-D]QOT22346.1 hypothetical protein HMI60_12825 [Paenarthrobacter sp. YJN-D]
MKILASRSPIAPVRTVSGRALLTDFVLRAAPQPEEQERGDVPGWVMITLMSAVLVAGLLALATPALNDLFTQAMSKVGK